MDVTSYLLGKGQGGGEVNLQDKEVTITQNGTQTITKDSGYDGLNSVEVTTSVPQPSGTINITENGTHDVSNYASANVSVGGEITTLDEVNAEVKKLGKKADEIIANIVNSYETLTTDNVTLYTPDSAYSKYGIVCIDFKKYIIVWIRPTTSCGFGISNSNKLEGLRYSLSGGNSLVGFENIEGNYLFTSLSGVSIKYSQQYTSLDDCINAIKNNNTNYTDGYISDINMFEGYIFYTNTYAKNKYEYSTKKISSNETIVAQS